MPYGPPQPLDEDIVPLGAAPIHASAPSTASTQKLGSSEIETRQDSPLRLNLSTITASSTKPYAMGR
jgi:hypothetical protein